MARAWLLDVPRHEPGSARCWRALRVDLEPQLRRPAGRRWPHAPREPGDGRCSGDRGTLRRYPAVELAMEKFTVLNGLVAPLDRANVDTDQIIPKQYLASIKRTGFAEGLFADWRKKDPNFVLNQPRFKEATILLSRKNFGCGSSREHAPWALVDWGFRCVIAPSYADIFFTNSFKNGFLPVILTESEVDRLFHACNAFPGFRLIVDLEQQTVSTTNQSLSLHFDIDPFRKYCLV